MKKKVLLLMCIALSLCSFSSAGAASPATTKMKMNKSEHNLSMYIDYDGQLSISQFDYSPNQISETGTVSASDTYDVIVYKNNDSEIQKERQVVSADDYIWCGKEINKDGDIIVAGKKDNSVHFVMYNQEGTVISDIYDKTTAKQVDDVAIKDNTIYYVCTKKDSYYLRSIDVKTGDVKFSKKITKKRNVRNKVSIINNRLYVIFNNKINSYSLKGKLAKTYTLPKLKENIIKLSDYSKKNPVISICDSICINGKYLYYSNGQKGIYRCPVNNSKKGFKLFYDAKKDKRFKDGLLYDMCILNNKTFYVSFYDKNDTDCTGPQWVIKYEK
ncbi:MAG: hypothetical protein E7265_04035 [Lachnospiraceae bacterium]|nr:hypothetical protein [Lachnospiraceae bacterium]